METPIESPTAARETSLTVPFNSRPVGSPAARAIAAERINEDIGLLDLGGALAGNLGTTFALSAANEALRFTPDPDFQPTGETIQRLAGHRGPDAFDTLGNALSEEHAHYLLARYDQRRQADSVIASYGWFGTAASFVSEIVDPANILAAAAVGPFVAAKYAGSAAKATTRLGNIARHTVTGVAADSVVEAARYNLDDEATIQDAILGVAAGASLSAALAGFKRGDVGRVAETLRVGQERVAATAPGKRLLKSKIPEVIDADIELVRRKSDGHRQTLDAASEAGLDTPVQSRIAAITSTLPPQIADIPVRFVNGPLRGRTDVAGLTDIQGGKPVAIEIRSDLEPDRLARTLAHEYGEAAYATLPARTRKRLDETVGPALSKQGNAGKIARILFAGDDSRVDAQLTDPRELFAELHSRYVSGRILGQPQDVLAIGRVEEILGNDATGLLNRSFERTVAGPAPLRPLNPTDEQLFGQRQADGDAPDITPDSAPRPVDDPGDGFDIDTLPDGPRFDSLEDEQIRTALYHARGNAVTGALDGSIAKLRSSRVPGYARIASYLSGDKTGNNKRDAPVARTLADDNEIEFRTFALQLIESLDTPMREWGTAQNKSIRDGYIARPEKLKAEFGEALDLARRGLDAGKPITDPHLKKASDGLTKFYTDAREYGIEGGVFTDELPWDPNYTPRIQDPVRHVVAVQRHGKANVEAWFEGSLLSSKDNRLQAADPKDRALAKAIAKKIVAGRLDASKGNFFDLTPKPPEIQLEEALADIIREGASEDIIAIINSKFGRELEPGKPADNSTGLTDFQHAKRRASLDEQYELQVSDGTALRLQDFIQPNAVDGALNYARGLVTAKNDLKFRRALRTDEDKNVGRIPTIDTIINRAEREGEALHGPAEFVKNKRFAREKKQLMQLYKLSSGRPIYDQIDERLLEAIKFIKSVNFVRVGSHFVLSTMPELFTSITSGGFREIHRTLSAEWSETSLPFGLKKGKASIQGLHDLLDPIIGTAELNHPWYARSTSDPLDEAIAETTPTSDRGGTLRNRARRSFTVAADVARHAGHQVAEKSLLGPITRRTAEMQARALLNDLARGMFARPGTPPKGGKDYRLTVNRMAELGLSPEKAEKIASEFAKKGVAVRNDDGSLSSINWGEMDQVALADIQFALHRRVTHAIQKQAPGDNPSWANHPLGNLFIQFRTFPLHALQNHTIRSLHQFDRKAAADFTVALAGAHVTAVALAVMKASGEEDFENSLRRNLSPDRLFLTALARTPIASLLPAFVDSTADYFLDERPFAGTRLSGGSQTIFDLNANPTSQTLTAATRLLSELVPAVIRSERNISRQAVRDTLGFVRAPGLTQAINRATADLPTSSRGSGAESLIDFNFFNATDDDN